jgi:Flp pilus assembly protein TadD
MRILALAAFAALATLAAPAWADANVTRPTVNSADFDLGSDAIKAKDWEQAVYHMGNAVRGEPTNADAQNLLGYAYRNQKKYDLAVKHYSVALRLDPKHKGAREYLGETYVLTGNKAKAQEQLVALEGICGKGCEEYQDLARALAQAK